MPSENAVRAMTAPETAAVFLHLLTISVDGEVILRITDNKTSITSCGNVYVPCGFTVLLPDQSTDGSKSCRLSIDNTDIAIFRAIKSAVRKRITADVAVIMSDSPDVYERGPLHFLLRNVTSSKDSITGELLDSYLQDRKFTAATYSPDDFPGMFY
ncbi:MAG: DUF1833 family protein [Treponema sp.]|nr:DUF1833 family protein [Treponema sp.]